MATRPTILLDLHGVCSNFVLGAYQAQGRTLAPDCPTRWDFWKELGISEYEFWDNINADPMFWIDLEPYPWLRDLVSVCEKYADQLFICTAPAIGRNAGESAMQTIHWVSHHIPRMRDRIIMTQHKALLSRPGTILIDDSPAQHEAFTTKPLWGYSILFPQPWNRSWEWKTPEYSRVEYVELSLELYMRELNGAT